MLFNSIDFAIFLPVVFFLYWFIFKNDHKGQNILLLVASYVFYGWWDWRFLGLILFSTIVDYFVGLGLGKEQRQSHRKLILLVSILVNLGFLAYFKYYNFFLDNFVHLFSFFGQEISARSLNIVLPVGISFYTFQTLSYSIDVYNKKIEPTKDFFVYSAYVSFFPQLVAGPIERATQLLPQFFIKRVFSYSKAVDGLRQILWGLFKKVVIADACAKFANEIFNNAADYTGSTLLLGGVFFAFQIYGDFSGYSDIAIGVARLFGFDLMKNFAFPYFSRDIAEFWRRWHISLTTWFRDYLYIPLGGSRGGTWKTIRNIFIIFLVSGFWHGANWTFIIWGAINAIYFLPLLLMKKNRTNLDIVAKGKMVPTPKEILSIGLTFGLSVFAWIFFRAENMNHLSVILSEIFSQSLFRIPEFLGRKEAFYTLLWCLFFFLVEWLSREDEFALEKLGSTWKPAFRWIFYYGLIYSTWIFQGSEQEFIYFQF
ncbi:MAG: MBOAT family O-acyltransferase [Anaerolineales bacterium]